MATVAIGDIQGNASALEDLLAKIMPIMSRDDTLVFLGDYIDRGPDTRGCLDRIVRLKKEAECAVVTLLGIHEEWMLRKAQAGEEGLKGRGRVLWRRRQELPNSA